MLNQQRSRPSSAIERSPKPRATCLRATPPTCFSRASGSAMGSLTSTWSRIRSPVPVRGSTGAEQFVVTSAHVGCVCGDSLSSPSFSHVCGACVGGGCLGFHFVDAMANGHRFSRSTPAQVPDGGGQEGRLVLRSPVAADLQSGHCTVSSCLFASALRCHVICVGILGCCV